MTIMNMRAKVSFDPEIIALEREFLLIIRNRLGISMHAHQNYELFKTIENGCEEFKCTPAEYLKNLQTCPENSAMINHLISGITVGETYFFRDSQQMDLLTHYLLPEIIKKKREKNTLSLRIWSAGCASGEEIYSVAMILNELLPDIDKWTLNLLATDINPISLQKGIVGEFKQWSMRAITEYYKNKYFIETNKSFTIIKKIKELVTFEYINLNEECYPSIFNGTNAQDLIICRNVLIYFNPESCHQLMKRFSKCLVSDGFLMLGASDPINIADTEFVFEYKKGLVFSKQIEDKKILEKNPPKEIPVKNVVYSIPKKNVVTKKIKTEIPINKPTEGIDLALEFANKGEIDNAMKLCEKLFHKNPTNKIYHFIYGLTLLELNRFDEAEKSFRKTIFLDHEFVQGHFQLGLLLLRKNSISAGIKCLKNALLIAEKKPANENVAGVNNLNYGELTETLRNEIDLHTLRQVT